MDTSSAILQLPNHDLLVDGRSSEWLSRFTLEDIGEVNNADKLGTTDTSQPCHHGVSSLLQQQSKWVPTRTSSDFAGDPFPTELPSSTGPKVDAIDSAADIQIRRPTGTAASVQPSQASHIGGVIRSWSCFQTSKEESAAILSFGLKQIVVLGDGASGQVLLVKKKKLVNTTH